MRDVLTGSSCACASDASPTLDTDGSSRQATVAVAGTVGEEEENTQTAPTAVPPMAVAAARAHLVANGVMIVDDAEPSSRFVELFGRLRVLFTEREYRSALAQLNDLFVSSRPAGGHMTADEAKGKLLTLLVDMRLFRYARRLLSMVRYVGGVMRCQMHDARAVSV